MRLAWVTGNEPMITVFSDRIEILSRGSLAPEQTMEGFFAGESVPVNKKLSEIKNTQSQLKDVNKLLKLDPGNTELLAQKHKLLGDAAGETKEKLETLKTAAEQANTALANGDILQEQYDALQREIVETENELKNLETQANQSSAALQKISATGEKLQTVGSQISSVGQALPPASAARFISQEKMSVRFCLFG